ncbi:MAG: hypothetical protein ABSD28_13250 [Tepidisphaeraceae bacterium]|jgi:hypothetical protein
MAEPRYIRAYITIQVGDALSTTRGAPIRFVPAAAAHAKLDCQLRAMTRISADNSVSHGRRNPSEFAHAAQIPGMDDLPPASLEIAEDAEKYMVATDEDRWTRMECKESCFELSVSI